ncbi:hypothetical protein [Sphingobacterium sp. UDSM-2020]|uniref:hypothetical protein n=1 Tax=Sphingobacterium sp. UDSM-2020 TaxID=2795738 RepID=UPI001938F886|nr:hypothetical protein [Sphingobacterium sp. UDSM-2020]QQD12162.1 hypothetical protein JAZ75_16240 [Sphingobacterium sp. UDSM-2020]
MSYLHLPRLTFSGDFLSDVSTVNNDTQHYNNATFEPSFQLPGQNSSNGWWNPDGGATFGFQNCQVMQVTAEDGTIITDSSLDGVIGQIVTGGEGRNSGKMVDLDPDQQMVSALWGVTFRILNAQNELLLEGKIKPTSFRDLQLRQTNGGQPNGQPLGGTWTSVLDDVAWGEKAIESPFLQALRAKTHQNKISINLNAFGYYYVHADGRFSLGRILGSIGPWFESEPELFAPARRLYGIYKNGNVFAGSNFLLNEEQARLSIDLGSSFPVSDSIGTINFEANLYVAVSKNALAMDPSESDVMIPESELLIIGKVPYMKGVDWINGCSGIVDINNISIDIVAALENNQLILVAVNNDNQFLLVAREAIGGYVCRADNFVQRIDTRQAVTVDIYAYRFGKPMPNQGISLALEPATPDTPKENNNPPISATYGNNKPEDGLQFSSYCTTNNIGLAHLDILGNSIHSPRVYIDGQIYWIDYSIENIPADSAMPSVGKRPLPMNVIVNQNMSISVHLRDDFEIPEIPVWSDIAPVMIQFANLYPIMSKFFINFADPNAVVAKKEILKFAFTRDIHDPIYMPVTRDLSENKRLTILKWLDNPIIDNIDLSKAKDLGSSVAENVALESTSSVTTEQQQQLKTANKAKNGSSIRFPELTNLFEF